MIDNNNTSLAEINKQDKFIANTLHADFLEPLIAIDCRDPTKNHYWSFSNLVTTIDRYLLDKSKAHRPFYPSNSNPYRTKRNTPINQVETVDDDSDIDSFHANYPTIAPFTPDMMDQTIHALQSKPKAVFNKECIVCKHVCPKHCDHSFSECDFLQNHPLCQSAFIKAMSTFNAILKEQRRFSEEDKSATIKQIQAFINDTAEQDFPSGNSE